MSTKVPHNEDLCGPNRVDPRTATIKTKEKTMGRPLNKKFFGEPTAGGNEIKVNFYNTDNTAVEEGTIIKQKGSKRFVVAPLGASDTQYTCKLVWDDLPANLASGEMSISFKMDDGETYLASKIAGRKVTLAAPTATGSNAYDGQSVAWNFATSTSDGAAQVEEAGETDDAASVTDDDFTEDA